MILLDQASMAAVTGGRWTRTPPDALVGVGFDSREPLEGMAFAAITAERDGHDFVAKAHQSGAVAAIVERPVDAALPQLVVGNVGEALAALARAQRERLAGVPVIAITGSAGKTTTRRMLEAVLAPLGPGTASPRSFNNALGVPVTLLAAQASDCWILVEIGTNAPGEIRALGTIVQPDLAVVTGTGRAHLEGFGDEAAIAREKMSLLGTMSPCGHAIVNVDRPFVAPFLKGAVTTYGEAPSADLRLVGRTPSAAGQAIESSDGFTARLAPSLVGHHNAINALAAIVVARRLGLDDDSIARGLGQVEPLPMRMERFTMGSICVWLDAYNANPDSMVAALRTFVECEAGTGRLVAVLGAMHELGEHAEALHRMVGEAAAAAGIDHLVVVGKAARAIQMGFSGSSQAVETCGEAAAACCEGDRVLIKASRGERLERVLGALEEQSGVVH